MRKKLIRLLLSAMLPCSFQASAAGASDSIPADTASLGLHPQELSEIVVVKGNVAHYPTHDIHTITSEMRRGARDAGDVLARVAGVRVDPLSREVSYLGSKNVVILVDSVERDEEYIKRLGHGRFDHVTVVPNPQGKYHGRDAVINFHTREHYVGQEGTLADQAYVQPSRRNGPRRQLRSNSAEADITYTRDKFNVSAVGSFSYEGSSWNESWSREFPLNDLRETALDPGRRHPASDVLMRNGKSQVAADYQISPGHSASVVWDFSSINNDNTRDELVARGPLEGPAADTLGTRTRNRLRNQFGNTLSALYRGTGATWQVNAFLSLSDSHGDSYSDVCRTDGFAINDDRRRSTRYVVGGADYARVLDKSGRWVAQLSDYAAAAKATDRRIGTGQALSEGTNCQNYLSAFVQYRPSQRLGLSLVGSLFTVRQDVNGNAQTRSIPGWNASVSWMLGGSSWLRLQYAGSFRTPLMSELTSYGQFTDSLVWSGGTPGLRNATSHILAATASVAPGLILSARCAVNSDAIYRMASAAEGALPGGAFGPYARYGYSNGSGTSFSFRASWHRMIGRHWEADAAGSLQYEKASCDGWRRDRCLPEFSCYGRYFTADNRFSAIVSYALQRSLSVTPQEATWGNHDGFGLAAIYAAAAGRLRFSLYYQPPLHFADGDIRSAIRSDPLVRDWCQNLSYRRDNQFALGVTYKFNGGKSVRRYDRSTGGSVEF